MNDLRQLMARDHSRDSYDSHDVLLKKASQITKWIKQSKHVIVFTGPGINNNQDSPNSPLSGSPLLSSPQRLTKKEQAPMHATPTLTHMAIMKLVEEGKVRYVISQNTDGLHRKSGLSPSFLSELYGNSNIDNCTICGREYIRDSEVNLKQSVGQTTRRACTVCGGTLQESTVKRDEPFPLGRLKRGLEETEQADLCIVLGATLTDDIEYNIFVKIAQRGYKVVTCHKSTRLDGIAAVKVSAKPDHLMSAIMRQLSLEIPVWTLRRQIEFSQKEIPDQDSKTYQLEIRGSEQANVNISILESVEVQINDSSQRTEILTLDPFVLSNKGPITSEMFIKLNFKGTYLEPPLELTVQLNPEQSKVHVLDYNPIKKSWKRGEVVTNPLP